MKKLIGIAAIIVLISALTTTMCWATPKALPAESMVSATCNGDNTATVTVTGVKVENFWKYNYFTDKEETGAQSTVIFDLDKGRRFNFQFDGGYYAGLSREMAKKYYGASFLGSNTDIDDSDPRGAAFIITCPVVKTK